MVERAEIQDLLVDQEDVLFVQGALDFYDNTVIKDDDIIILNNREALKQGIENLLRTPTGVIDGVGMERFGTDFLTLRGQKLTYHTAELGKKYIQDVIPQTQNKIFKIEVDVFDPNKEQKEYDWSGRFSLGFILHVSSVYGDFSFPIII